MTNLKKLIAMLERAIDKKEAEYAEFLDWHESIVRSLSDKTAKAVGNLSVNVVDGNGKEQKWGIELTPTDHVWWREHIADGARFVSGTRAVKAAIIERIGKAAEAQSMSAEDRSEFLDILKSVTP